MRLIDADEIRWTDHYDSDGNLSKYKIAFSDEMPPVVDAVPVIRCKNCHHFEPSGIGFQRYCSVVSDLVREEDYCCWAERREE